jgi:hypothetical protein
MAPACRRQAAAESAVAAPPEKAAPAPPAELVTDKALVEGRLVLVSHSRWDGGQTADLFDANPGSLARTEKANPAILELRLPEARPLSGVSIQMGGADFRLTATLTPAGGGAPKTYTKEFRNTGADPDLALDFDTGTQPIESLRIELLDLDSDDGHIHIRTVRLR